MNPFTLVLYKLEPTAFSGASVIRDFVVFGNRLRLRERLVYNRCFENPTLWSVGPSNTLQEYVRINREALRQMEQIVLPFDPKDLNVAIGIGEDGKWRHGMVNDSVIIWHACHLASSELAIVYGQREVLQ